MEEFGFRTKETENYLDRNVYYGLPNCNKDAQDQSLKIFSETDFRLILNRVKEQGLGIDAMEFWAGGETFSVLTFEQFTVDPTEAEWYEKAFDLFCKAALPLQYSATFYIPWDKLSENNHAA